MKAARAFVYSLRNLTAEVGSIEVSLHGSLAWTGKGHGTDSAVLLGLSGLEPDTIDPDGVDEFLRTLHKDKRIDIPGIGMLDFDPESQLVFDFENELPRHTNGMRFIARSTSGDELVNDNYYSLGGGFIARNDDPEPVMQEGAAPLPFTSCESLLQQAADNKLTIAELVYRNEVSWRDEDEVDSRIAGLWSAMEACIERGLHT